MKLDHKKRPLSWSQISQFKFDKSKWYSKYVLDEYQPGTPELTFGSMVGKRLETDPTYLPMVPRFGKDEYPFSVKFNKRELVGYADSFDPITFKRLGERKTGVKKWDQKRCSDLGQLRMYCLMNFIQNKVKPEDVEIILSWLPTKKISTGHFTYAIEFIEPIEEKIQHFKVKLTMKDILLFGKEIKDIWKQMDEYAKSRENDKI